MFQDELFDVFPNEYVLPYAYVHKRSDFTDKQMKDILGDVKLALTLKKVLLWIGVILGPILTLVSIYVFVRVCKLKREESHKYSVLIADTNEQRKSEKEPLTRGGPTAIQRVSNDPPSENGEKKPLI